MQNNAKGALKTLGLTGGIASGKSVVSSFLREKSGYILDADKISHSVILKGNPAYNEIFPAIEGDYLAESGEIDRKKLGSIVFNDKEKLKKLEEIVHKHTIAEILKKQDEIIRNPGIYKFIVIDAPLLIESGLNRKCDLVWVILSDYETRIERIVARNGLTKDEAATRINVQTDWDNLQKKGLVFINNNRSIEYLLDEVNKNLIEFLK